MTPLARDIADNLIQRRTERARNTLVTAIMRVQAEVKMLMFKYIQIGVQARGVSVLATKNIIDAVKVRIVVPILSFKLNHFILEHLDLSQLRPRVCQVESSGAVPRPRPGHGEGQGEGPGRGGGHHHHHPRQGGDSL